MTMTLMPWFRDFFVDFLKKEDCEELHYMAARFENAFVENHWKTAQSFYVLDFLDSEIELLKESGFHRMYDALKEMRRESRRRNSEYNYITYRMKEFVDLVRKLTGGQVVIHTVKRRKKLMADTPVLINSEEIQRPQGCHPSVFASNKEAVQKALDELQACIVLAGGSKISIQDLANRTLAEVMFLCVPNSIAFKARLTRLPRETPDLT